MYSARQRFRRLSSKSLISQDNAPQVCPPIKVLSFGSSQGNSVQPSYPISQEQFPYQRQPNLHTIDCAQFEPTEHSMEQRKSDNFDKKVSFQPTVKVVLIPHISEYESAGLIDQIWYGDEDINAFKCDAFQAYQQMQFYRKQINNSEKTLQIPLPITNTPWVA